MLTTSNYIKNYKKYLLRGTAVSLQLTNFCPDRLQPFGVCSIFSSIYHSGGFQKLLEASFYKAVKNQKPFAFYKGDKNQKNHLLFIKAQKIIITSLM